MASTSDLQTGSEQTTSAPELGIGLLGYGFIARAHMHAYKRIPYVAYPPPAVPRLAAICGLDRREAAQAAQRYGFARHYDDWRALVDDETVQVFDNGGSNDVHAEASIAAAQAGKPVFCEKPMARSRVEAAQMLDAVRRAGVKHMVGLNYRFVPALREARALIERGALGRIYTYRATYLQEWLLPHYHTPFDWHTNKAQSGSGVLGDLGTHIIDLGRFLVGEIKSVSAMTRTFIPDRPRPNGEMGRVDVDDAFTAALEFENDALGTLAASRVAGGRKNRQSIEINAERGSLYFDLERLNELGVYWVDEPPRETEGFRTVLMTERTHPYVSQWWPPGHVIGWEHPFVHELTHWLDCVANNKDVAPEGATFEDGYRAAAVCDAILESAQTRRQVDVCY